MTVLRQMMIDVMRQHGFVERTQVAYLSAVTELARYFRRSPDALSVEDLQRFFDYLVQVHIPANVTAHSADCDRYAERGLLGLVHYALSVTMGQVRVMLVAGR